MPQALVIFTDASGSGNTAYFSSQGQKVVQTGFSTTQHAELQAIILACQDFAHVPFNLYTDSAYVYGVLKTIETAYIGPANDEQLFHLFHELRALLQQCQHPYFVGHLRSHYGHPGPLAEGNCQADALVSPLILQVDNSPVNQAIQSHSQFHQNSRALHKHFHIT
jgi:ribonuclease HI